MIWKLGNVVNRPKVTTIDYGAMEMLNYLFNSTIKIMIVHAENQFLLESIYQPNF